MSQNHSFIHSLLLSLLLLSAATSAVAQKTYIVCVGVGANNSGQDQLNCPRNDMNALARFYKKYNGTQPFVLLDANATRSHILKVLKEEFAKSTPDDEIIFAYSGHGMEGLISTYNFKAREVVFCYEVQKIMLKAKARRKMMFVDSCHSGTFARRYRNVGDRRSDYLKESKVLLFLSSRADESSLESTDMKYSYFNNFLLRGLSGKADKNGDKKVTARELFNYVAHNVEYYTQGKQHPVMWGQFPDDMVLVYVR